MPQSHLRLGRTRWPSGPQQAARRHGWVREHRSPRPEPCRARDTARRRIGAVAVSVEAGMLEGRTRLGDRFGPSRIFSAAELMAEELPPVRWVVPGLLPEGVTL